MGQEEGVFTSPAESGNADFQTGCCWVGPDARDEFGKSCLDSGCAVDDEEWEEDPDELCGVSFVDGNNLVAFTLAGRS
jgi:hypothetical protein